MVPYVGVTFNLPSILVPPEVVELDSLSTESGEDALIKKEEWPEFYARLFDHDVRNFFYYEYQPANYLF
jgi:nuclear cap-binding protein subunit 1